MRTFFYLTFLIVCAGGIEASAQFQQSQKAKQPRPNILFIVIDDASWPLSPPNTPSYVSLPGFDSVRLKGVTVKSAYCNFPLCNPSRISMLTSLYPHQNGAVDNGTKANPQFRFFTQALHDAGYHINVCGKCSNTIYQYQTWADQKRWMVLKNIDYINPPMYLSNGSIKTIIGNTTSIIGDTTNTWLATIDTPFCFWEGVIVPHTPTVPLPSSKNMFKKDYIPLKTWVPFTKDYPSFAYSDPDKFYISSDSNSAQKAREKNYECYVDIDASFTKQINTLRSRGLLDNTMIFIINDNGYLNGEHLLKGKEKPYYEALGLPCYIRYKPWFPPGSVMDSVMFTNLDVGPTLLDVARVNDATFQAQQKGTSIRTRISQGKKDSLLYYEDIRRSVAIIQNGSKSPSFRGVRSFSFNYVWYHCDSLTEQLFDLKNDPNETTNVINKPAYASVAARYRFLRDSFAIATHDSFPTDTFFLPCTLTSVPPPVRSAAISNDSTPSRVTLSPNPADKFVLVEIGSIDQSKSAMVMTISNSVGAIILSRRLRAGPITETTLDVHDFPDGLYFARIMINGISEVRPFIVDHGDGD